MDDIALIDNLLAAEISDHRLAGCGEGRILEGLDRGQ